MITKVIKKLKNLNRINKVNKVTHSNISFKTSILRTVFEGHNAVYSKTKLVDCNIGYATYISSSCFFVKTKIGRYSSIASNVKVIAGTHPSSQYISTHPLFYTKRNFLGLNYNVNNTFQEYHYVDYNNNFYIEIGNDVWIGEDVRILDGVSIGDGAIIAAGALVTKNVPAYAIVGGVNAKIIKYRFDKESIEYLLQLQWWNKGEEWIKKNAKLFNDINRIKDMEQASRSIKNEFVK